MNKVIGCIDGSHASATVVDYAAWAATRMLSPLEFLHVLDRHPETAPVSDYSGSLVMDSQEALLEQLSELDARRSKLAQEHGRVLLEAAKQRARASGFAEPEGRQRHGALVDTLAEMEEGTRLVVMGQRHHTERLEKLHLDHTLERVIRTLARPVLATADAFKIPERFLIAFDGSPTGRRMVERVAASPLLACLPCHVVMASAETPLVREQLDWAHETLVSGGFDATTACAAGEPEAVLNGYVREHGLDLLVIGAYGHSRIRHLVVGSTTTTLLRTSPVPVLVLR